MSFDPKEATADPRDDRQGLDLLAAMVEEVATELPEYEVASWPPSDTPKATPDRRPAWLAMAAVLAAMVLAWPAYLGLVRLPRVTAELQVARLATATASQHGPVEMKWLSPPRTASRTAGELAVERVERRAGHSAVWLLEVPMGQRAGLAGGARVEISGATRLGWELDPVEIERQLDAHDGVAILICHDALALGRQRLRLIDTARQEVAAVELLLVAAGDGS